MNKVLLITVILFFQTVQSQNFKFGKVSKEELLEKEHSVYNESSSAVLFRSENIRFEFVQDQGFKQVKDVHERIKIYNKDGFDQSTKIIRLYDQSNKKEERVTSMKAYTYNLEGGKIEKTKLKKDGIFDEKTNKYWKEKKITMPNIKEGSVVEIKYTISSPFLQIDEVKFQQSIPINHLDFKFKAPEYYKYKMHFNPLAQYIPKLVESQGIEKVEFSYRKEAQAGRTTKSELIKSTRDIIFKETVANLTSIPPIESEPLITNLDNYRAKVQFELSSIQYPNQAPEFFASTWDQVTNSIFESESFGGQLDKSGFYEKDIESLLSAATTDMEKAGLIYSHVKTKVKWNGFVGLFSDNGVKQAYRNGEGNNADINLLLTSMLRYAGLNANPVLVSTKDHGIPLFPTRNGFNYVISAIELQDGLVLLDASSMYSMPNILPTRALNWKGRMIRERGSSAWINLLSSKPSQHKVFMSYKIDDNLVVTGKIRDQFTDHYAYTFNSKFFNTSDESIIENLERKSPELKVTDLSIKNQTNSKPILQSYSFTVNNVVDKIGEDIYMSPLLFLVSEESPFKQEKRNYPVDFIHPYVDQYMINIEIPEGYTIESLPENKAVQLDENDVSQFSYLMSESGKAIQLKVSFNFNYSSVPAPEYPSFRQYYNSYLEKLSEKIVLKKVE